MTSRVSCADAAHAKHRPVAIHSYGASGVKDAVRAGADSIEHGIDLEAPRARNEDNLVQVPRCGFLDVGGRVRRDVLVQHGFVIEARNDGDVRRIHPVQPV